MIRRREQNAAQARRRGVSSDALRPRPVYVKLRGANLAQRPVWDTQRNAGIAPGMLLHFAQWAEWVTKREPDESVN